MDKRPKRPTRKSSNTEKRHQTQGDTGYGIKNTSNEERYDLEERARELEYRSKKKKQGLILKIGIGVVVIIALYYGFNVLSTGMNDKRVVDLNNEVANLESVVEEKNTKIEELRQAIEDTTVKEVVPITSLQRVEGSEVPQLNLIDGDFIAPNIINLPTVKDDVNNSYIQVGSRFKFTPSDSWIMVSQGTTVEFSHPTKIWGKIKAITQKERVVEAEMQNVIKEFFVGYPSTTINYRKVFIGDYVVGMLGEAPITVTLEDGSTKEMVLTTGFIQRGDYGLNILFVYDKDNIVGKELISALLNSGTFSDSKIVLE